MHKLSGKNCLVSGCTASCLTILLVFLVIWFAFSKLDVVSKIEKGIEGLGFFKSTQLSHLYSKDKPIKLRVGLISDSESDWDYLEIALTEIKSRDINKIFHLGDITHLGVSSDLQLAKDYFIKSGIEVYPIPGDRDLWKSRGLESFQNVFGDSYRVVELSGVRFMLIDNADEYEGIGQDQLTFISENLNDANFVLFHNPVYFGIKSLWGKGMGEYSVSVDLQRKDLLGQIRSSPSVLATFAGDQHLFSENVDDIKSSLFHYIIGSTSSERNIERPNFAILTVYDDGDYYVEKVSF